jgi:uncharacterized membrane protein YfcA
MTALALFGMEDMQQLNAMKVVLALVANLCAIVTFILTKQIVWHYCLVSMVFAGAGGWMGAHFAKRTNPAVLRGLVVATGCAISAYFFWRQAHVR